MKILETLIAERERLVESLTNNWEDTFYKLERLTDLIGKIRYEQPPDHLPEKKGDATVIAVESSPAEWKPLRGSGVGI